MPRTMSNSQLNAKVLGTARDYLEEMKVTTLFEYMLTTIIIDRPEDVRAYIRNLSLPPDDEIYQEILNLKISPEAQKLQEQVTAKIRRRPKSFSNNEILPPISSSMTGSTSMDSSENVDKSKRSSRTQSPKTQTQTNQRSTDESKPTALNSSGETEAQDIEREVEVSSPKAPAEEEEAGEANGNESKSMWGVMRKAKYKLTTAALVKRWVDHGPEDGHHGDSHADTASNRLSRKTLQNHGISNGDVLEALLYNRHHTKSMRRQKSNLSGMSLLNSSKPEDEKLDHLTENHSVVVPELANDPETFEAQEGLGHGALSNSMVSLRGGHNQVLSDVKKRVKANKTTGVSMKMIPPEDVVEAIPVFHDCTDDFKKAMIKAVHMRLFRFHERICTRGTDACTMYYIAHGAVEVISADGELVLADLEEGNHFGEGAILNHAKRTSTVRAATNTILMCISKDAVFKAMEDYPENKAILELEAERLREFESKLVGTDRLLGEFEESFIEEILKTIPMFKSCNHSFLHQLAFTVEHKAIHRGVHVVSKGDVGHEMFFIVRGTCGVMDVGKNVIATLTGGHFFGEIGVLFEVPRTFDVVAHTECDLIVVQKEKLEEVMRGYPEVKAKLEIEAHERYDIYNRLHNSKIMFGNTMEPEVVREGLGQLVIFKGCEQPFLHALALAMKPFVFKHNEVIYKEDVPVDQIIYLVEGSVTAYDGDGMALQEFLPQTLIGLEDLVLSTSPDCDYKADSFGFGMACSREEAEVLLQEYMDDLCLIQEHAEISRS